MYRYDRNKQIIVLPIILRINQKLEGVDKDEKGII